VPQPAPARGRTIANQDAGTVMSPLTSPPKAVTWQDDGVSIVRHIDDDEALCSRAGHQSSQADNVVATRLRSQRSSDPKATHPRMPRETKPPKSPSPSPSPPPERMRKISLLSGPDSDSGDNDDHFRRPSPQSSRGCDYLRDLTPSQARDARWQKNRLQNLPLAIHMLRPEEVIVSARAQGAKAAPVPPQHSTEERAENPFAPIQPFGALRDNLVQSASEDSIFRLLLEEERASNGGATAPGRSARYVWAQWR